MRIVMRAARLVLQGIPDYDFFAWRRRSHNHKYASACMTLTIWPRIGLATIMLDPAYLAALQKTREYARMKAA